jgi:isopentenyl-diphosphate delta-isomerase
MTAMQIKSTESVILVNSSDQMTGTMEKLQVHVAGKLHRAFSVFIFSHKGELLLQQRASGKYHSPGLWTNACCGHPRPGEETADAAHRRLIEEMGIDCFLTPVFQFTYEAALDNGLTEHEFDHVFFGISDQLPAPEPEEVGDYQYLPLDSIEHDLIERPGTYSEWLKICFGNVKKQYRNFSTAYETRVD